MLQFFNGQIKTMLRSCAPKIAVIRPLVYLWSRRSSIRLR
jgi:hypothetical protein